MLPDTPLAARTLASQVPPAETLHAALTGHRSLLRSPNVLQILRVSRPSACTLAITLTGSLPLYPRPVIVRGQQCRDAFSDRCAQATQGPARIDRDLYRPFPQVNPGIVGLAGLEPAASSLSGIEGYALCGPAFPEVAGDREG
jgi:hypothetical protein